MRINNHDIVANECNKICGEGCIKQENEVSKDENRGRDKVEKTKPSAILSVARAKISQQAHALLPSNSIIKLVHIISFISNIKVQIQTISEISEKGTKGTKGLIGLNLPHTEDNTEDEGLLDKKTKEGAMESDFWTITRSGIYIESGDLESFVQRLLYYSLPIYSGGVPTTITN